MSLRCVAAAANLDQSGLALAAPLQAGRFQTMSAPGRVYVIDTATGQVWERFAVAGEGSSDDGFKSPKVKLGR